MTAAEFDACMSPEARKMWRTRYALPLWWCWTAVLSNEVQQRELERSGFRAPVPTFVRLLLVNDENEIWVQELVAEAPELSWNVKTLE